MSSKEEDRVTKKGSKYKLKYKDVPIWRAWTIHELKQNMLLSYWWENPKRVLEFFGLSFKLADSKRAFHRFRVYISICVWLPCTITILCRRVGISTPTAYSYLKNLISWGIVERKLDEECDLYKYHLREEYQDYMGLAEAIHGRMYVKVKEVTKRKRFVLKPREAERNSSPINTSG